MKVCSNKIGDSIKPIFKIRRMHLTSLLIPILGNRERNKSTKGKGKEHHHNGSVHDIGENWRVHAVLFRGITHFLTKREGTQQNVACHCQSLSKGVGGRDGH